MVTPIPISSLIQICPNTNMLTQIQICVRTFFSQNAQIPDRYSTWYLTSNKGQFLNSDTWLSYSQKIARHPFTIKIIFKSGIRIHTKLLSQNFSLLQFQDSSANYEGTLVNSTLYNYFISSKVIII